mmetsp:Transcript_25939/g.38319  ORF Transcript_25939/g.38319 Transcript_25939/m.38319 type:complete len:389 (-) Transcript_25939:684-1850(-)
MADFPSFSNCELSFPSFEVWKYAILVHGLFCVVALFLGLILYHLVRWGESNEKKRQRLSIVFAICALVLPLVTHSHLMEKYSPNKNATWIAPFLASTFGFSTFFKSVNVGLMQFPEGSKNNLKAWLAWFVLLPEPIFVKGNVPKASMKDIANRLKCFLGKIAGLFVVLTILVHYPGYSIDKLPLTSSTTVPPTILLHINGYVHLWLICLWASLCLDISALSNLLTTGGMQFEPGFSNPLLESRCLKEAWAERWNLPVHTLLKRTIYVPSRKQGWSRTSSALLTFFVSGWLHEYTFFVHNRSAYEPGKAVVFFLLMGFVMVLESWFWTQCTPLVMRRWINENVPSMCIAISLSILLSGVFEQYFIQSWLKSGFVDAIRQMLPHMSGCRW